MSRTLTFSMTLLAMLAFACNSLLCRLALQHTGIDPASFASIRIISGALMLWIIMQLRGGTHGAAGSWWSALALFAYATSFSYAYVSLSVATGALLLIGAVQATMIGYALWTGERLKLRQSAGLVCAFGGIAGLLLPGVSAPAPLGSALMLAAGIAWGIYSLRGKGTGDPASVTTGNFLRAAPMAAGLAAVTLHWNSLDTAGFWYALTSGAVASGLGYVIWYTALRGLRATTAATVQLSVPVIAALGGVFLLGEAITWRLLIASVAILGGIALVVIDGQAVK